MRCMYLCKTNRREEGRYGVVESKTEVQVSSWYICKFVVCYSRTTTGVSPTW